MDDLISRQAAIEAVHKNYDTILDFTSDGRTVADSFEDIINALPPAQPEIIRCKDCKFYSPMNRETKTGICSLTMHQNFGDNWFCAGAERRTDEVD